jgi:hypothetical protein
VAQLSSSGKIKHIKLAEILVSVFIGVISARR